MNGLLIYVGYNYNVPSYAQQYMLVNHEAMPLTTFSPVPHPLFNLLQCLCFTFHPIRNTLCSPVYIDSEYPPFLTLLYVP